jgi:hypothetical protein
MKHRCSTVDDIDDTGAHFQRSQVKAVLRHIDMADVETKAVAVYHPNGAARTGTVTQQEDTANEIEAARQDWAMHQYINKGRAE